MRVSADLNSDILFEPSYSELPALLRVFSGRMAVTKLGWTFKEIDGAPLITIKDNIYYGETALKTRSYNTKQQLLTDLKLCVDNGTGEVLNASQGVILGGGATMTQTELGFTTNHIPQLFRLVPNPENNRLVITSFSGDYNFKTQLFRGFIEYKDYSELWNEQ